MAAAAGMSTLKSSFCGASLKTSVLGSSKTSSQQVSFAVRAAGYDEELVKTAVSLLLLLPIGLISSLFKNVLRVLILLFARVSSLRLVVCV